MYCKLPYNGMTIQPTGDVGICCSQHMDWSLGKISEVEDLYDSWKNHQKMINLKNNDSKEINNACGSCLRNKPPVSLNRWHEINSITPQNKWYRQLPIDGKIRFLEFTTSNICNQACTTCSSFFSSKWKPIEKEALEIGLPLDEWKNHAGGFNSFGFEPYRMKDSDIEKIFKLLPDLYVLYVKGGEPFADNNNYRVLERLSKVNPGCKVFITSNMAKLPEKYLKIFKNISFVNISCSIDGIDKTYEYVRSTLFEETIENIKRFKTANINSRVSTSFNVSIHNMFNVNDYIDYFSKNLVEEISSVNIKNWVRNPQFVSPLVLFDENEIDTYIDTLKLDNLGSKINLRNLIYSKRSMGSLTPEYREKQIERFHSYTKFMNYKRGINAYDLHPQLLLL